MNYDLIETTMRFCDINTLQNMRLLGDVYDELGIAELRRSYSLEKQSCYYTRVFNENFAEYIQTNSFHGIDKYRILHCRCGSDVKIDGMKAHRKTKKHRMVFPPEVWCLRVEH